jgi:DNA repair exonuclease SbcCD ATPase subunit
MKSNFDKQLATLLEELKARDANLSQKSSEIANLQAEFATKISEDEKIFNAEAAKSLAAAAKSAAAEEKCGELEKLLKSKDEEIAKMAQNFETAAAKIDALQSEFAETSRTNSKNFENYQKSAENDFGQMKTTLEAQISELRDELRAKTDEMETGRQHVTQLVERLRLVEQQLSEKEQQYLRVQVWSFLRVP